MSPLTTAHGEDQVNSAIHIGGDHLKDAAAPLADAICKIMAASGDQETVREALRTFAKSVIVENITLAGATVDARTINIDPVKP